MNAIAGLFGVVFFITPFLIVSWALKYKAVLGNKSILWASIALLIWLIKAGYIFHGAMSCMGGHCVKEGEEYKDIIQAIILYSLDIFTLGFLYFYISRKKSS